MATREDIRNLYLQTRGTLLRALPAVNGGGHAPSISGEAIRRILFIRLDRVGDVVLSTPALEALKTRFPGSELTVLTRPQTSALLDHNPHVDRRVVLGSPAGPAQRLGILRELRRRRFDLAIDPCLDWTMASALVARASSARIRIGYPGGGREALFTAVAGPPDRRAHMAEVILGTLGPLGIDGLTPTPRLYLAEQERAGAAGWLAERAGGSRPIVGIHPGAFYETQRWPGEHYATLADRLGQSADVVLFGGPSDERLVDGIRSRMRHRALRHVTPDIRRFAAVLSHCRLLVCNNSGPLHVASSLGIPTVSFMGPTEKERWLPLGERHVVLRMDGLACIGCNRGACPAGTLDCMRRITPQMAADAVLRLL